MMPRLHAGAGRSAAPLLAAAALALLAAAARAQTYGGVLPFDPYQSAYRSSSVPTYNRVGPNGSARLAPPPGMGTVPGIGNPNDTGYNYSGAGFGSRLEGYGQGAVDPYAPWNNDAYRKLDEQYGRLYQPNAAADDLYNQGQEERDELYRRAMTEPDPQLRARYLREYRAQSRRISLGLSPSASNRALSREGAYEDLTNGQPSRGSGAAPRVVRSYDDLLRCAQAIDRAALRRAIAAEGPAAPGP